MLRSLVGSEMCIRDRYQRRVRGQERGMAWVHSSSAGTISKWLRDTDLRTRHPPASIPGRRHRIRVSSLPALDTGLYRGSPKPERSHRPVLTRVQTKEPTTKMVPTERPEHRLSPWEQIEQYQVEERPTESRGSERSNAENNRYPDGLAAVIVGALMEGDESVHSETPISLPGAPELSEVVGITSDDFRVFMTTTSGTLHQWVLMRRELQHVHHAEFTRNSTPVLEASEHIQDIQVGKAELQMLTTKGRVLQAQAEEYDSNDGGVFVWRVKARDVTPFHVASKGRRIGSMAVSPYCSAGWVIIEQGSKVLPLYPCQVPEIVSDVKIESVHLTADSLLMLSTKGKVYEQDTGQAGRRIPRQIQMGPLVVLQVACGVANLSLIHISEPTRLLSISYAVFCLKKKKKNR
eukprot:TRINITY_DN990_c0_g1_i11.p1 TRINITY_DN990_c0_g1~~TRINITY_DN990_c0_g1_i11.p1  ORF type:complete len:406 (+),score=112.66 TRINITY_DN990_c0_g1_i11:173-1390(+)